MLTDIPVLVTNYSICKNKTKTMNRFGRRAFLLHGKVSKKVSSNTEKLAKNLLPKMIEKDDSDNVTMGTQSMHGKG